MTNEIAIISEEEIKSKIYIVRGVQVMLDSDLAKIYGYTTKSFNQQVKNNIERFDDDFRFQLTKEEYYEILRSKKLTLELEQGKYSKYLPYVFTEDGIYMLMTVLKGKKAILQSKALIRIFRRLKDYVIDNNLIEQKYINNLVLRHDNILVEHDSRFIEYDSKINNLSNQIGSKEYLKSKLIFENEIYNAYSFLLDIFSKVKEEIIIIDNYCDKKVLDLISKIGVKVIVISKNMDSELIDKYQKQYNNLIVKYDNSFHDRFIIIDKKIVYQLGSSLKDLGKKCSYINMIEDEELEELLKYLKVVIDK